MKKKHIIILLIAILVIIGGSFAIKSVSDLKEYQKQVSAITISNVDLSKVSNGAYLGKYDTVYVGAEVRVTIDNHKIEKIELLKHRKGTGTPAEIISEKVVEAQSLDVDIVSGATASSKVILKAIENALTASK